MSILLTKILESFQASDATKFVAFSIESSLNATIKALPEFKTVVDAALTPDNWGPFFVHSKDFMLIAALLLIFICVFMAMMSCMGGYILGAIFQIIFKFICLVVNSWFAFFLFICTPRPAPIVKESAQPKYVPPFDKHFDSLFKKMAKAPKDEWVEILKKRKGKVNSLLKAYVVLVNDEAKAECDKKLEWGVWSTISVFFISVFSFIGVMIVCGLFRFQPNAVVFLYPVVVHYAFKWFANK